MSDETGDAMIFVNDPRLLVEELRALVMNHGASGLDSPVTAARLRAQARVSWLAARLTFLESEELLSNGIQAGDQDDTADLRDRLRTYPARLDLRPVPRQ